MNRKIPSKCDRCGRKTGVFQMSRFNTEMVCVDCIADEKEAPGYKRAAEEEYRQVVMCQYNFPGVGLDPLNLGFVCGKMAGRGIGSDVVAAYAKKHGYPYPENNLPDDPVNKKKGPT